MQNTQHSGDSGSSDPERNGEPLGLGLQGSVVVVTGAAGGIGRAVVDAFLKAGASVAALDRDEAACRDAVGTAAVAAGRAVTIGCDVSDEGSVENAAHMVGEVLGTPRVLVNNAAILEGGPLLDVDLRLWHRVLDVNLTGYLLCTRAFGRWMRDARDGSVVHVASIGGRLPQTSGGPYCVSKVGVRMLSQVLAVELGEYGVRSNVVSPAMVVTPMSEASYRDPDWRAHRASMVPSGRIGEPCDIANAVLWLAGNASSYVNGQEIAVDGGFESGLLSHSLRGLRGALLTDSGRP